MASCITTSAIGIILLALGGGGSLKIAGLQGFTAAGSALSVIIVLGLLGVSC